MVAAPVLLSVHANYSGPRRPDLVCYASVSPGGLDFAIGRGFVCVVRISTASGHLHWLGRSS